MKYSKTEMVVVTTAFSLAMLALDSWFVMLIVGMMHAGDPRVPPLGFSTAVGALLVLRIAGMYLRGSKEFSDALKNQYSKKG